MPDYICAGCGQPITGDDPHTDPETGEARLDEQARRWEASRCT